MDASNPAGFVNAELLRMHVGRRVRAVIQVLRNDAGSVTGKSTDEHELVVKGHPSSPITTFVEVIGFADSSGRDLDQFRRSFWYVAIFIVFFVVRS